MRIIPSYHFFLFLPLIASIASCGSGQTKPLAADHLSIKVSSDFDGGGVDTLVESPAGFLTGKTLHWKHKSSGDDQYYWFYFKLNNTLDKTVSVRLTNLEGIYRGKPHLIYNNRTRPVYSYDWVNWQRINDVVYDSALHTLTFKNIFNSDSVWIAYAHPYPYEKGMDLIRSISSKKPYLAIEKLGASAESRDIHLLTITDPAVREADKKVVLITTLQHAGEYCGGFFVEGMIHFLLSEDPAAAEARSKVIFKIIPMMNPDGIFHGITRLNGNMEDLNQEWDDDLTDTSHAPTEPEVACVKQWIRNWRKGGKKIDLGLDVHSQGQEGDANILHTKENRLDSFAAKLNKYWPVEHIPMTFSGSANDCLENEFHIPSGTFEIPQSNIDGEPYLTIEDYHSYGKGTALAIRDYFKEADKKR